MSISSTGFHESKFSFNQLLNGVIGAEDDSSIKYELKNKLKMIQVLKSSQESILDAKKHNKKKLESCLILDQCKSLVCQNLF